MSKLSHLSMVAGNKFRFLCPTLGRAEYYLACLLRRHKHWRGEKVDGGCATCMRAGKCAADRMLRQEMRAERGLFIDTEGAKLYHPPKDIREALDRIIVLPSHAAGTDIDPATLSKLVRSDAPVNVTAVKEPPATRSAKKPPQKASGDLAGALDHVSTDMAKAINKAAGV